MSRAAAPLPVNIRKNADVDNEIVNLRISEGEQLAWSADPQSGRLHYRLSYYPICLKDVRGSRRAMRPLGTDQVGCADHAVFL